MYVYRAFARSLILHNKTHSVIKGRKTKCEFTISNSVNTGERTIPGEEHKIPGRKINFQQDNNEDNFRKNKYTAKQTI